jgi:tetratricopeptide (TPR) repeat protein
VFERRGDGGRAREQFTEALKLDQNFLDARLALAKSLLSGGSGALALEVLDKAPENQKSAASLITQRNWILLKLGKRDDFAKGVERALSLKRTRDALVQHSVLMLSQKKFEAARSSAEEVLLHRPEDAGALEDLMLSYAGQRQLQKGLVRLSEHVAHHPQSPVLHYFSGRWLVQAGRKLEARSAFSAALAADPYFFDASFALAQLDLADGKREEARKWFEGLAKVPAFEVQARIRLANLDERQGNFSSSIAHYRRAIELDKNNAIALNNLAYLLAKSGQADEAINYAQQVKELAPNSFIVDDTIGWAYYQKGIYANAVKHLEKAVSAGPSALRRYHLAMAYFKAGETARGKQTLALALQQDPTLPEAKEAKAVIGKME